LARGTRIDAQSSPRAPNFGETGLASLALPVAIEACSAALLGALDPPGRFLYRLKACSEPTGGACAIRARKVDPTV
jgi:hypothetical protein